MFPDTPKQENHTMQLAESHPDGMDEFYCPICDRRLLIQWNPEYKKIVIEPGDEHAIHSGGKGGLRISSLAANTDQEETLEDDGYLDPWKDWMARGDFDRLWGDAD